MTLFGEITFSLPRGKEVQNSPFDLEKALGDACHTKNGLYIEFVVCFSSAFYLVFKVGRISHMNMVMLKYFAPPRPPPLFLASLLSLFVLGT